MTDIFQTLGNLKDIQHQYEPDSEDLFLIEKWINKLQKLSNDLRKDI